MVRGLSKSMEENSIHGVSFTGLHEHCVYTYSSSLEEETCILFRLVVVVVVVLVVE